MHGYRRRHRHGGPLPPRTRRRHRAGPGAAGTDRRRARRRPARGEQARPRGREERGPVVLAARTRGPGRHGHRRRHRGGQGRAAHHVAADRRWSTRPRTTTRCTWSAATPDIVNKLLLAGTPKSPLSGAVGVEKVAVWSRAARPDRDQGGRQADGSHDQRRHGGGSRRGDPRPRDRARRRPARPVDHGPGEPAPAWTSRCRRNSATSSRWSC